MSEQHVRCDTNNCKNFFTMKNRNNVGMKNHKMMIDIEKVDFLHMHEHHIWLYAEYLMEKADKLQTDNDRLRRENAAMKAPKMGVQMQTMSHVQAPAQLHIEADPMNHVDGFCDAIFLYNGVTVKCAELCKYKSDTCALHIGAKNLLERRKKTDKKTTAIVDEKAFADRRLTKGEKKVRLERVVDINHSVDIGLPTGDIANILAKVKKDEVRGSKPKDTPRWADI